MQCWHIMLRKIWHFASGQTHSSRADTLIPRVNYADRVSPSPEGSFREGENQ